MAALATPTSAQTWAQLRSATAQFPPTPNGDL
jgi:hypothetical protein